jgi:hypothetical protein
MLEMTPAALERIALALVNRTAALLPAPKPVVEVTPLSPKALAAQELIKNGDFGCRTRKVGELISLLLGEKLVVADTKSTIESVPCYPGMAIYMLDDVSDFEENDVLIIVSADDDGDGYGLSDDADSDYLGGYRPGKMRPASLAETTAFIGRNWERVNKALVII